MFETSWAKKLNAQFLLLFKRSKCSSNPNLEKKICKIIEIANQAKKNNAYEKHQMILIFSFGLNFYLKFNFFSIAFVVAKINKTHLIN